VAWRVGNAEEKKWEREFCEGIMASLGRLVTSRRMIDEESHKMENLDSPTGPSASPLRGIGRWYVLAWESGISAGRCDFPQDPLSRRKKKLSIDFPAWLIWSPYYTAPRSK
jgi:hypothetical protein